MFFIGIFGIENKSKVVSSNSGVCPICGVLGRYELIKSYNYFHFFFIPLFRWNTRYFIQTNCCKKSPPIDLEIGRKLEARELTHLPEESIHPEENSRWDGCPVCGAEIGGDFRFCPYCGGRL